MTTVDRTEQNRTEQNRTIEVTFELTHATMDTIDELLESMGLAGLPLDATVSEILSWCSCRAALSGW